MATIVKNEKGFKVIKCSMVEISQLGGLGICDYCNKTSSDGYYIAVLNCWYCPECYKRFIESAIHYPEDMPYEEKNFEVYRRLLKPE